MDFAFVGHTKPLQQRWAGCTVRTASPLSVFSSLQNPSGSPLVYHRHNRVRLLMHFSTVSLIMKPHPFFSEENFTKHMLRGKIIKSSNWVKIWSLFIWRDPQVTLWDWSQGLQLLCLSLVVKEHRTWPAIYWEIHSWRWFLSSLSGD